MEPVKFLSNTKPIDQRWQEHFFQFYRDIIEAGGLGETIAKSLCETDVTGSAI